MDTFHAYDSEFQSLTTSIQRNLDQPSVQFAEIDSLFKQCNELLKEMTVGLDSATRRQVSQNMTRNANLLASLKHKYETIKLASNRSELVGEKSMEDRQKGLVTTERLERSNDILLDSIRTIAEIDQTGQEISGQLRQNRETIESVRARNQEFRGVVDESKNVVKSMERRDKCPVM